MDGAAGGPVLPDHVAGFAVQDGQVAGEPGLPAMADADMIDGMRRWLADLDDPYYVRFDEQGLPLDTIQRLARLGELWVDAGPEDMGDVLDLAFSGSARVVCDVGVVPDDDLEDTFAATDGGIILAVGPDAEDRLPDAEAWAEAHGVPILLRDGLEAADVRAGIHVYQARPDDGPTRFLHRVAGPAEASDDEE